VLNRFLTLFLFFILLLSGKTNAQGICPLGGTSSSKLICVIPQTFGPFGLGSGAGAPLTTNAHQGHFESDFLSSFGPINEAIGVQISQLPLASPSSGLTFRYDPTLKTFAPSQEENLGPILGERATTIGRRKLYVAFSFQYFNFNSIDGQNTSKVPAVFQHQAIGQPFPKGVVPCPNQTGLTGTLAGQPCFVRDFIQTRNNLNMTEHQYTIYVTYGLTSHLDVSLAIPLLSVSVGSSSNATIVPNSHAPVIPGVFPNGVFHEFNPAVVPSCGSAAPCLNGSFASSGSAAGIGDVILRGKYEFYQGERLGVSAGVDVRLPSGDAENFLGSGSTGARPFGVISYSARVSPHAILGYEWNSKSILAGDFVGPTAKNTKGSLPNRFVYVLGADVSIVKRLTAAFDLYGQHLFGVPQLYSNPYTDLGSCSDVACTTLTPGTAHPDLAVRNTDYSILNASVGLKYLVVRNLVVVGNVLLKLNDNGLRATAVPLVGASYTF